MHQEITASAFLPRVAAAIPRSRAAAALTPAVSTPIRILRDSPARVLASISRPIQSVPNSQEADGGRFFLVKSVSTAFPSIKIPATVTAARISTTTVRNRAEDFLLFFSLILLPPPSVFWDPLRRKADLQSDFRQIQWPM